MCIRDRGPGGESHKIIGLQPQGRDHRILNGLDKLGDAAYDLAVFIQTEPVGLAAGDHLYVGQSLVNELPGLVEIADYHGLDPAALKGAEACLLYTSRCV